MLNRKDFRRALLPSLVISLIPGLVNAAGFALIENNARGQGNAYAGAAAHTPDASTIHFNPAGLANLEGDHLTIAAHYIVPHSSFNNNGSTAAAAFAGTPFASLNGEEDDGGAPALVPNIYWVKSLSESTKFGIGFNAPFGLATRYDDDWIGRYHGVESDLRLLNFNPSIGYKVNERLNVGFGADFIIGDVVLSSAIDFGALCFALLDQNTCVSRGALPQQADGFAHLEGDNHDDIAVGYNLGLQYKVGESGTFGLAYRSEIDVDMEGTADFRVPQAGGFAFNFGLFLDTTLKATVTLPQSLSLSYAHQSGDITYLADVTWTGWSSFQELRINYTNPNQPDSVTTESWNDVYRYSVGMDYQYAEDTIYRIGIAYDESPVPSAVRRTPRLPGTDRTWLSLGVSKTMGDNMSIDIGYSHLFLDNAPIDNEFESSIPTLHANLKGEYSASINIFSVQVNWQY